MPADIDTNLQVQQQITQMLRTQNELYLAQARLMRGQLAMMQGMAEAMGNVDVERMNESVARTTEALDAAEQALEGFNRSGQNAMSTVETGAGSSADAIDALGDSLVETGQSLQTLGTGGIVFESLKKAANTFYDTLGGISGLVGTIFSGIWDLGTALLAIPIGIFEELQSQAAALPRSTEFAEAVEELRGQFGSLATNEGAAVMDMFHSLGRTLGDTDLNTRRILGNRAQQLRAITELAKSLGSTFNTVMNEGMVENAANIVGMQKALAISDESMQMFARNAMTSGRSLDEAMREHGNMAIQMGKAFGISSMEISRGMQEMENDMKHFGGLSTAQLGEVTVYAKKLGIEVKTLTGIMDTFDNFDSAADAAARLNQQFGIQLETLDMLREEDPARRADMLRDSLNAAGVSYADLDRRSKTYLASQLNISEAEAQLLFNQENRGLSLDDIKKKSEEAEKKQLDQVEVMHELADAIKRLVQQGAQLKTNIFENFTDGIMQGIMNSREMRTVLRDIAQVMRIAMQSGRELGRAFMATFPGIREIFGGFRDFFNPSRWRGTFREVVDAFKQFFRDISVNPESGVQTLFQRLKKAFFDHFDNSTSAGSRIINGFKTFFKALFQIVVGAVKVILPEILKGITEGLKYVNDLIKNGMSGQVDEGWEAIKTSFGELFGQLGDFFGNLFDEYGDDIWNGITSMFGAILERILPWFEENWTWILGGLAAFFAGPSIISALTAAVGGLFGDLLGNLVGGEGGGGLFGSLLGGLGLGGAGEAAKAGAGGAGAETAVTATAETSAAINDAAGAGGFEGLITNLATILAGAEGVSLVIDKIFEVAQKVQESGISTTSIITAVAVMGAATLGIYGIAEMISGINEAGLTATIIASVAGLLATIITGGALTTITTGISTMLSPGGIFDQIFDLGDRLARRAGGGGEGATGPGLMEIGGILAALATFLGSTVPTVLELRDANLTPEAIAPTLEVMKAMVQAIADSSDILDTAISNIDSDVVSDGAAIITGTVEAVRDLMVNAIPPFVEALTALKEAGIDFTAANTLLTGLLSSISEFVKKIIDNDVTADASKIKAVADLAPLITGLGSFFSNIDELAEVFQTRTTTTTNAAGVVSTSVANFDTAGIGSILYAIGGMVKRVLEGTAAFQGMDPAAVENIGTSVAAISRSMLNGIAEIIGTLMSPEVMEILEGENYQERINALTGFLQTMMTTLFSRESGFMKALGDFITTAGTLVATPEQANVVNAVAELMETLLDGVNTLSQTIIDMADMVFPGQGDVNSERLEGFLTLTLAIFDAMKTFIPDIVANVINAFKGVDVGRLQTQLGAVERIITLLTSVVTLSSTLKELSDDAASGGGGGQGEISIGGLQNIKNMFVPEEEGGVGLFDIIQTIINNTKTLDIGRIPSLKGITKLFENVVSITESVSSIAGAGLNDEAGANVNKAFNIINGTVHHIKVLKGRMTEIRGADFSTLVNVSSQISQITESISSIPVLTADGINSFGALLNPSETNTEGGVLQQLITDMGRISIGDTPTKVGSFNQLLTRLATTANGLSTLNTNLLPIASSANANLRSRVSDLMGTITDTVAAINEIGTVELSTTLEKLEENFGLGRSASYTVSNENFQLNISMRVVIDAGTFESVFFERARETTVGTTNPIPGRFTTGAFVPE